MSSINMNSIQSQVEAFLDSSAGNAKINEAIDASILKNTRSVATAAASDFIEVMKQEIQSLASIQGDQNLGDTGVSALTKLTHGRPRRLGKNSNKYQIDIWFTENLSRDSLDLDNHDGIDNLAALINNGYTAKKGKTYGVWLGHNNNHSIPSRPSRPATHFIQNAMRTFKSKYGAKYGLIDIDCDNVYKQ